MNEQTLRDIHRRLRALEDTRPRLRIGEVIDNEPLSVALGGASTPYTDVASVAPVGNGDTIAALTAGNDLLVLGALGPPPLRYVGAVGQPAFEGAWVNFDNGLVTPGGGTQRDVGFYRHAGRVYLTGIARSGVVPSSIFTLPAGYRPGPMSDLILPAVANSAFGLVQIFSSGAVFMAGGSNVYLDLSSISFRHA